MSDIRSKINDDVEDYVNLCKKYKEKVQYKSTAQDVLLEDCYGEHAKDLKVRDKRRPKKSTVESVKLEEIEIELDDKTFMKLALMAHELNITFNQLCNNLLEEYIDDHE